MVESTLKSDRDAVGAQGDLVTTIQASSGCQIICIRQDFFWHTASPVGECYVAASVSLAIGKLSTNIRIVVLP